MHCHLEVRSYLVVALHTDGGKEPTWNEVFTFRNVTPDQTLKLEVRPMRAGCTLVEVDFS